MDKQHDWHMTPILEIEAHRAIWHYVLSPDMRTLGIFKNSERNGYGLFGKIDLTSSFQRIIRCRPAHYRSQQRLPRKVAGIAMSIAEFLGCPCT